MEDNVYHNIAAADVAVIMSVYKNDKVLPLYLAMLSITNQSYNNCLIFVAVDGEVNEPITELLTKFSLKDNRIFILKNRENIGLAKTMNFLIDLVLEKYSSIKFLARMDADDISKLDRIENQITYLKLNPSISVLGGGCEEFGLYHKEIIKFEFDSEIKKNIIKVTPFIHPSVMFRSSVFFEGIRYPCDTELSEDLALWLKLCLSGYKFHNLKNVLIEYRLNNSTLKRRTGLKKAYSELKERMRFILSWRKDFISNSIFTIGHFILRLMPICVVKIIYNILR